ncbi:hypothetical protein Vretimale_5607, partial [Volvox reticuliferus]
MRATNGAWGCLKTCWTTEPKKPRQRDAASIVISKPLVRSLEVAQRAVLGLDGHWLSRLRDAAVAVGNALGATAVRIYGANLSSDNYVWLAEARQQRDGVAVGTAAVAGAGMVPKPLVPWLEPPCSSTVGVVPCQLLNEMACGAALQDDNFKLYSYERRAEQAAPSCREGAIATVRGEEHREGQQQPPWTLQSAHPQRPLPAREPHRKLKTAPWDADLQSRSPYADPCHRTTFAAMLIVTGAVRVGIIILEGGEELNGLAAAAASANA